MFGVILLLFGVCLVDLFCVLCAWLLDLIVFCLCARVLCVCAFIFLLFGVCVGALFCVCVSC